MFGHILEVLGLVLTGGFAIRAELRLKTVREAKREVERRFALYMASQEFENLVAELQNVHSKVRALDWDSAHGAAIKVVNALGRARAPRVRLQKLLKPLERDNLDAAMNGVEQFIRALPLPNQLIQVPDADVQAMLSRCCRLAAVASEVGVRLRVESMVQPEDKK